MLKRLRWRGRRGAEPAAAERPTRTLGFAQAFFDPQPVLPFSKSPSLLDDWLSRPQPEYDMASWCFYGNVETDAGLTVAVNSIAQQQLAFPENTPYLAEFSYCDDNTNGYALAPFLIYPFDIQFGIPFSVKASFQPIPKIDVRLALLSGQMGMRGARYRMSGLAVDLSGVEWQYDVQLADTLGAIQVGYGPQSFYPQWLTPAQKQAIVAHYADSVPAYLDATRDKMTGQGSFYYSLPLLKVDSFSLKRDGQPYAAGSKGNIWVDYVVQGFTEQSLSMLGKAAWQFFAVQFPGALSIDGFNAALVVSIVDVPGESSKLPMARFYRDSPSAERAQNGSLKACFEWKMDQIKFEATKHWTDGAGKRFPVAFTLTLESPEGTIVVWANAVRDNQVIPDVEKYEGVYDVIASIKLKGLDKPLVKGYAWAEVH